MRTVKLKSKGLGRYDEVSPFLLESGELELQIELPKTSGDFFLVAEINGKNIGAFPIPKDGKMSLFLSEAGELRTEVKHYLRGQLIETYKVEPLLLKAVDAKLSAMPEFAALTAECDELRKRTNELAEGLQRHKEETEQKLNKIVTAFLSFAYAEYRNDVQLNSNSLSAEKFAEVLGFEEIKITEDLNEKI